MHWLSELSNAEYKPSMLLDAKLMCLDGLASSIASAQIGKVPGHSVSHSDRRSFEGLTLFDYPFVQDSRDWHASACVWSF